MNPIFLAAADVQQFCDAQGWLDLEGIILRQGARLDTNLIVEELGPLLDLKGTTEDLTRLQGLFRDA